MRLGARKHFAILTVLFLLSLLVLVPVHAFAQESDLSSDSLESIVLDVTASGESLEPVSSPDEDAPEVDGNVTSTLEAQVNPVPSLGNIEDGELDTPATATPIFDPPYTEVTLGAIEGSTEENWKERLGLPTLVTVDYANAGSGGASAGHPASGRLSIVDWMLQNGEMLSLAYLKAEAARLIDATLVIYLIPVFSDKGELAPPEWAQIEPVNYLLIVDGITASGPSQNGATPGSSNTPAPGDPSFDGTSPAYSSTFHAWPAFWPTGVAYADTTHQEDGSIIDPAVDKEEMRAVPTKASTADDKAANAPLNIIKDPTASVISLIIFIAALILLACVKWNTGVLLRVRNYLSASLKK